MSRATQLLDRARDATSLDNFGEDGFREGLETLVASADAEARLSGQGRAMFDAMVVDLLSNRLQIEHWYGLHPEIDEEEIIAPLIGLGAPRTGSTALACMLAEDPAIRFIRTWESQSPCPPPDKATEQSDPRISMAAERLALTDALFPRMKAMLPLSPTAPIECQSFMAYDFKSQFFLASAKLPSYVDWLLNHADLEPTYRYVKRVLKLLQWRCPPGRWRLKNPSHTPFIAALDKVFPDARYWMTHRDMRQVIPSVVDLYHEMSRAYSDAVDGEHIVQENELWWETGLRRLIAFRDAGNDHRFFDVRFDRFQHAPFDVIADLYAFLGETLTQETLDRMEAWRNDNARGKHGGHSYDAAKLGIDPSAIEARFRFYSDRFALSEASTA